MTSSFLAPVVFVYVPGIRAVAVGGCGALALPASLPGIWRPHGRSSLWFHPSRLTRLDK